MRSFARPVASLCLGWSGRRPTCPGYRTRISKAPEYRGNPCHETASAPTTRYSTSFEFKHSIDSRKSLLKGIGVGSLSQFKEYADPLLRGHLSAGKRIGGIGLFKAGENADYFLHDLILRWFFDYGIACRASIRPNRRHKPTVLQHVHPQHPPHQKQRDHRHHHVSDPLSGSLRFGSIVHAWILTFPC